MNLGGHSYTPGEKAPIEILLLVFLLLKYECRWCIYSAAGQPILSRAVFLIRETPSLSNIFIPLVYFFHVMYMLTAVVPDLSEKGDGRMGRVSLVLFGTARPLPARLSSPCLLSAYSNRGFGCIILKHPQWPISLGWHLLQRAVRLLVPHLWLALALCSCSGHKGQGECVVFDS